MKTSIFSTAVVFLMSASGGMAQFGIHAGGAFSKSKSSFDNISVSADIKTGFTGGIAYRMPIGSTFSFQPEVNYLQKGWRSTSGETKDVGTLNFLEVPLYFLYTTNEGQGFFAGAGPSLNFGMSGKYKYEEGSDSEEGKVNFGNGEDDSMKGFHLAINAQAGYRFQSGFTVNAFANQTITNSAIPDEDFDYKLSFFTFGARVGYFLPNSRPGNAKHLKNPL